MEGGRARVPVKPGYFTVPDGPVEPPRLLGSRCRDCGEHFFPRRAICAKRMSERTEDVLLGPRGTLFSYTFVHFPLFGMWAEKSNADMAREARLAALRDAGLSFRDVQAAYVGYIFAPVMSAVRTMKEFGLTGIPVQRVENASATGSAAFREACFAVE